VFENEGRINFFFLLAHRHGHATTGTSRDKLSGHWLIFFLLMGWHDHATTGTGRANAFGQWLNFFSSSLDNYLQNKTTQNKQNKSN